MTWKKSPKEPGTIISDAKLNTPDWCDRWLGGELVASFIHEKEMDLAIHAVNKAEAHRKLLSKVKILIKNLEDSGNSKDFKGKEYEDISKVKEAIREVEA